MKKEIELEIALNDYIKEKRTQDECVGFIDGFKEASKVFTVRKIYSFKKQKLKFWFRLLAVKDVLFCKRFELVTWNSQNEKQNETNFCEHEVDKLYN